jgi:hypothetical protein
MCAREPPLARGEVARLQHGCRNTLGNRIVTAGLIAAAVAYGIYLTLGVMAINRQPAYVLEAYAMSPHYLPRIWRFLPHADTLALRALRAMPPADLQSDFRRMGFTLYSGGLGSRDINVDPHQPLSSREEKIVEEFTAIAFQAGVRLGQPWVDPGGCSSVHQALIERNASAARFLLRLENLDNFPGNPAATSPSCRQDATTLAEASGLTLR